MVDSGSDILFQKKSGCFIDKFRIENLIFSSHLLFQQGKPPVKFIRSYAAIFRMFEK